MAKRRGRPVEPKVEVTVEDTRNSIRYTMALQNLAYQVKDMTSLESVNQRINDYFSICEAFAQKPGIAGLALAFGVTRTTFLKWLSGTVKYIPEMVVDLLNVAFAMIDAQTEAHMLNGEIPQVAGIFIAKNSLGYQDETRIEAVHLDGRDQKRITEDLRQKYLEAGKSLVVDVPASGAKVVEEKK